MGGEPGVDGLGGDEVVGGGGSGGGLSWRWFEAEELVVGELEIATLAAVRAFDTNLVTCLNKAWSPKVIAAQVEFTPPRATDTVGRLYSHHVQQLTGILANAQQRAYVAPNLRLEQGRRIELQASCLSGLFIGANRSSYGVTDLDLTIYRQHVVPQNGATRATDRASAANRQYWAARGLDANDIASCNTFTAPATSVS